MISVSSIDFDVDGLISFEEDKQETNYGRKSRRGNRIATLDGGSVVQDRGYSDSDLTFQITVKVYKQVIFDRLSVLLETTSLHRISTREGVFIGQITNLDNEKKRFNFDVSSVG